LKVVGRAFQGALLFMALIQKKKKKGKSEKKKKIVERGKSKILAHKTKNYTLSLCLFVCFHFSF